MSLIKGPWSMSKGTAFRNVDGSAKDPKPMLHWDKSDNEYSPPPNDNIYQDWDDVWEHVTQTTITNCAGCNAEIEKGGRGLRLAIGGHIVIGDGRGPNECSTRSHGDSDEVFANRVFIVPLCKTCNGSHGDAFGRAQNVFHSAMDTPIVHLCYFMTDERFNEAATAHEYYQINGEEPPLRYLVNERDIHYRAMYDLWKKAEIHVADAYACALGSASPPTPPSRNSLHSRISLPSSASFRSVSRLRSRPAWDWRAFKPRRR
ncbi:hypothetical protein FACS18949_10730 [Clostridia bacterium]|nr:hypothetical protein FACS18949_10730 [Clostridia bacterium]